MTENENRSNNIDLSSVDLAKLTELVNRLDASTISSKESYNASEINSILSAVKDHLSNPAIQNRLSSNQEILEQKLPNIFNHFCKISIRFSSLLSNHPLFMINIVYLWNIICSKLGKSIENELLSTQEYYNIAMEGLSTDKLSMYLTGTYAEIFLKLAKMVIWADSRQMEHLNLSDYTAHKCLHEEKYDAVYHNIIIFIDNYFGNKEIDTAKIDYVNVIFSLIVIMADSKSLLPTTIRIGFPAKLIEWLDVISSRNNDTDPLGSLIIAVSNISQCEEGITALNEACAITALGKSEKALANRLKNAPSILSFYSRIYAMIATTDQLKTLPVLNPAIDVLLKRIHEANASSNLRSATGHLYEYLVPLAKLLINDNMAKYVLENNELGGLTFFIELFHKHNVLSVNDLFVKHLIRLALYNILCRLAFHQSAQKELKEDQKFIVTIMEASKQSTSNSEATIPSSLRNNLMTIKTAADGILVYLDKFKTSVSNKNDAINTSTTKIPMISYSHKDADFCRSVVAGLKQHSISVWMDEDGHCLSDDCWEEIAIAIKNASTILILVSENYCTKSDSCRVEATYAIKLKIPIIALYIDDKYQAEPWLDIHLTGLHVKFGKKSFTERITRLATYISARNNTSESTETMQQITGQFSHEVNIVSTKEQQPILLKSKIPETVINHSIPTTAPRTWSAAEVQSWWCTERALVPQLCTFYDGEALCVYARLFLSSYQENPVKHFQILQERLKREHGINFYDDSYANTVSSMMWIIKQNKSSKDTVDNHSNSTVCTLS
ncbi:unnamed protein product [Adineta steineri]|uniref:TIR domain-containing protein n=2 Tax=Adineta steineri TaxID=433720 RepID=A0A814K785_9BILA|nr:unnamed protein product [Adineta steineri]